MKKNKMITDEMRTAYQKNTGMEFPEERYSGKTVGLAFLYIGTAMNNPGSLIRIHDHKDGSDKHLQLLIKKLISKFKLQYLDIKYSDDDCFLQYNIFE